MPAYGAERSYSLVSPYPNIGPKSPGWTIGGVRVDNPTNVWWVIEETGDLIPPYTLGWVKNIRPTITSITLVNSLTTVVVPTGSTIGTLWIYEVVPSPDGLTVTDSVGGPLSYATVTDIATVLAAIQALAGGFGTTALSGAGYSGTVLVNPDGATTYTVVTGVGGKRIFVTKLRVAIIETQPTRSDIQLRFIYSGSPGTGRQYMVVSPERTVDDNNIPAGTIIVPTGESLQVGAAVPYSGPTNTNIQVVANFYLIT